MTYREALYKVKAIIYEAFLDRATPWSPLLKEVNMIIVESLDSGYQEPGDNTPDNAPVWEWDTLIIGHNKEEYSLWRLKTWKQASSPYLDIGLKPPFPNACIALAKENQGPPPTDWTPGGK